MARYAASNQLGGSEQNLTTTYKTLLGINAATGVTTLRRGWIDEIEFGADGAAVSTDCQIVFDASVMTAAGTATAVTPNPTPDGADAAALLTYSANYTAEPTVTANSDLLTLPVNQRQSQRIAFADFRLTPLIVPAVNLKGIVLRAKSTNYNSTAVMQAYSVE